MLKALKKDKILKILMKENINEKEHLNTDAAEHTQNNANIFMPINLKTQMYNFLEIIFYQK